MTPEQQRIAIAKACGITNAEYLVSYGEGVPDYLHDLNAMHEAEKSRIIGTEYESDYCMYLYENAHQCFATAPQRAEAFLRTLSLYTP